MAKTAKKFSPSCLLSNRTNTFISQVSVGDDYETDKYLITVDSEMTAAQQAPAASVKKDIVTAADTATDSTVSTDRPVVPAFTNKLAGRSRKVSLMC